MSRELVKLIVIQVSPYTPEPGTDYHEMLANELVNRLQAPVIVLAGLNYLPPHEAYNAFMKIERQGRVLVVRAFWAPRILECKDLGKVVKYVVLSLKILATMIRIAKKYANKVVTHFHYGLTTWPGAFLGEYYILGMVLARLMKARVIWTVHAFLTPHQLLQEAREQGLPLLLSWFLIVYYLLLAKIAALACHKVVVLVNSSNAPIVNYLSGLLGRNKVIEQVHPLFKPLLEFKDKPRDKIIMVCLGYIRREKGYHILLKWLANLRKKDLSLYNRINVIIAGTIDRKKRSDIEYLKHLIHITHVHKLNNVKFIIQKLKAEEFNKLLAESTIVWCAYSRQYGPSGILAWARTYRKKVVYLRNSIWGKAEKDAPNLNEHVDLILLVYNS